MELQKLQYEVQDHVAIITMDYPKNLNAIDELMADELTGAFAQAEQDPEVHVIVLRSAGRAFSAGGDIGYFYKLIQDGGEINMDGLIGKVGKLTNAMKGGSKMIIAEVNGAAAGAGFPLALSADFVIASESTKFIMAFVNIALVPDTGGAYLLTKEIGEKKAMEFCATGRPVTAAEAKDLGIVYKVFSDEELHDTVMKFAGKLSRGPLVSYKNIKKQIYASAFSEYERYLTEVENPLQHECSNTADFIEGCSSFMEKRKAQFQGK